MIHGGDIYNNKIELDYSVNVSPLGIPEGVQQAVRDSLKQITNYPDYGYTEAVGAIAEYEKCDISNVLCTNGASEAFMAIVRAYMPKKALLVCPCFSGYEYCLRSANSQIYYYCLREENSFVLKEDYLDMLDESIDMIFIGNPNNPTGRYVEDDLLERILDKCRHHNITVVLDQCFYLFGREVSVSSDILSRYHNVIIVSAFTKICALAGLRAGYILSDSRQIQNIRVHLPEWNVSVPAANAMKACVRELLKTDYLNMLRSLIRVEREYLTDELKKNGIKVYDSDTNFILIKSDIKLYELLLKRGILIRDCSEITGLGENYYRLAIMNHTANKRLVNTILEVME